MTWQRATMGAALAVLLVSCASPSWASEPVGNPASSARTVVLPWLRPVRGLTTEEVARLLKEDHAGILSGGCGNLGLGDWLDFVYPRSRAVVRFRLEAQGFRTIGARQMTTADQRALRE